MTPEENDSSPNHLPGCSATEDDPHACNCGYQLILDQDTHPTLQPQEYH